MAEPISIQQLKDASEDAITLADFIYKPANVMIPRRLAADINSLQYYLDYMSSYAQHSYETYDEMVTNAVNLPNGVSAFVTNDLDATKNGIYTYNGTSFVKGEYQPEKAAKEFVEAKLGGLEVFDGKIRAQDVSTIDGLSQSEVNSVVSTKLARYITPFDFGAIGDGLSHKLSERYSTLALAKVDYPHAISLDDEIDWAALQALLTHARLANNRSLTIDWGGNWVLNRSVYYGVMLGELGESRTICGDFHFKLRDDFDGEYVIMLHGRLINHTGVISGDIRRLAKFGIYIDGNRVGGTTVVSGLANYNSYGINVDRVYIDNALITAVKFNAKAMFCTLNFFRGGGHGVSSVYAGAVSKSTVSEIVDTYINQLVTQSRITVSKLPEVSLSDCDIYIEYGGYISVVKEIDHANKTVTVEPNIPASAVDLSKELSYIWGSAVTVVGSDTAGVTINQMSAIGCGIGLEHKGMYGISTSSLTVEFCAIGVLDYSLVGGVAALDFYSEGGTLDYATRAIGKGFGSSAFLHGTPKNFAKWDDLTLNRNADGTTQTSFGGLRGVIVNSEGVLHSADKYKRPANYTSGNIIIDFNLPHSNTVYKGEDDIWLKFVDIVKNVNDLFCYDSQEITIVGTGQNNAPQGDITISPLDGYTLNGGTSNVVLSGFSAACHIIAFLDVVNKNIRISCSSISGNALNVSTEYPFTRLNADPVKTGSFTITDYTQVGDMPTPTATTVQALVRGYIISGSVWVGDFKIIQEVTFPGIHEVWTRTYNNIGGVFSAWVLKDYVIRKGATAERPTNPQLGMQFYDTTLLGVGKPINWNGTAWVDAMGVAV